MDLKPLLYWSPQKKMGGGWICFKDSPSAPVAPDPTVTANAQTASNLETARKNAQLNRVNQYTPWGSQTYSQVKTPDTIDQAGYDAAMKKYQDSQNQPVAAPVVLGEFGGDDPRSWSPAPAASQSVKMDAPKIADYTTKGNSDTWNSTVTLDPAQQKLLDASNKASQSMADLGNNQIQNVANTINKPLDFSGLPQLRQGGLQTSAGVNPDFQTNVDGGNIQGGVANAGDIQRGVANAGNIQRELDESGVGDFRNSAGYGTIQNNLDVSGVPGMVGGDALSNAMTTQQQAAFNQQKSYLDPQWNQQQHDLENKLVQQGVLQNSDAWNRAVGDFSRNRTFAYQNANDQAVAQGNAAQAQLYNQGLSSNQNAYNQAMVSGNFANAAQSQGFGQDLSNANLNNSVVNNQFGQAQARQAALNAAQAQQYGQNANDMAQANAAQGQKYGQNSNDMAMANAAQGQLFTQGMGNANLYNTASQNRFNNGLTNAQLNNQAMGQDFAQSNTARNQGINELLQQQQNPLNVLNALRSGAQVTAPQFGAQPQTNMAGTDVMSPINNAFNAQMGQYNSDVVQNNAFTSALGTLGGYALGGPMGGALGTKLFGK